MRRVLLLRHGRTEANDRRLYCGSSDLPLSPGGAAELAAKRDRAPDLAGFQIYTSGLRRTEETLRLLWGERPHGIAPGLREMDFGAFELKSYEELKDDPRYRAWCAGDNEKNRCPGGESGEEMAARVCSAFRALPDGDLLLVTHGGPIAALMARWFPDAGRSRYEWQPENGGGWEVRFEDGVPVSVSFLFKE